MNFREKTIQLCTIIYDELAPLIDNDFVLLDLPYHTNIGDILIWEGEIQFLKQLKNYKLLYLCSVLTYHCKKLKNDTIIFLHGGGNFGDVWHEAHKFKEKIITSYPDNKIIIFPQTVWYNDESILFHDAQLYAKHNNLTICARDKESYEILKQYFTKNTVLLVPDMAFCIPSQNLRKYQSKITSKTLFLKRTDRELDNNISYSDYIAENDIAIRDWQSMEKQTIGTFLLRCFLWMAREIHFLFPKLADIYASLFFRQNMTKTGVKFISRYKKVYTTRLHAAILCCLLEKPFVFFDNTYGKNSSFFETWLNDLDKVEFR
jgi:pyruvyl transferase EpsO